jgi:hypothetical protein
MIGSEGCEIGYKEQVEEQLDCIGFVPLAEDEVVMIGSRQRRLDKRRCLV